MPERPAQWASAKITVAPDNSITKGNHRMPTVDDLLCSATESQLRNVLAMLNLSESELNALFEHERVLAAKEDGDTIL